MMRRTLPLALILLAGCGPRAGVGTFPGQKAPELVAQDAEGKTVRLSDFRGKVVLIDFWATWCQPCVASLPYEKELTQKYSGKPFALLGVSQDFSEDVLKRFLQRNPLPWPNVYGGPDVGEHWQVEVLPTFVLIDPEGMVRERWTGARIGAIERGVADLMKTVNTP